jgi:hypothetical protein
MSNLAGDLDRACSEVCRAAYGFAVAWVRHCESCEPWPSDPAVVEAEWLRLEPDWLRLEAAIGEALRLEAVYSRVACMRVASRRGRSRVNIAARLRRGARALSTALEVIAMIAAGDPELAAGLEESKAGLDRWEAGIAGIEKHGLPRQCP